MGKTSGTGENQRVRSRMPSKTDQLPKRTPENAKNVEYYKDDVDVFDVIKGHLIDEGYANTEEAALVIMANMSEEWRTEIIEGIIGQTADNIARTVGTVVGTGERAVRELPGYLKQKAKM